MRAQKVRFCLTFTIENMYDHIFKRFYRTNKMFKKIWCDMVGCDEKTTTDTTTQDNKSFQWYGTCGSNPQFKLDAVGSNCVHKCENLSNRAIPLTKSGEENSELYWRCNATADRGSSVDGTTGCVTKVPNCPKPST